MWRYNVKEISKETEAYIESKYGKELNGIEVFKKIETNLVKTAIMFGAAAVSLWGLSRIARETRVRGRMELDIIQQQDEQIQEMFRLEDVNDVYSEQQQTEK